MPALLALSIALHHGDKLLQSVGRGFGRPAGLAIDLSGGKLYFGDTLGTGGRGEILRADLDGTDLEVIYDPFSTLFSPLDVELGPNLAVSEPTSQSLAIFAVASLFAARRFRRRRG